MSFMCPYESEYMKSAEFSLLIKKAKKERLNYAINKIDLLDSIEKDFRENNQDNGTYKSTGYEKLNKHYAD